MDVGEYALIEAAKTTGVVVQKGIVMLRPHFALFAPTDTGVNVLASLTVGVAGLGVGVLARIKPGEYTDIRGYVYALVMQPAQAFDADAAALRDRAGWWFATPADTKLTFNKVALLSRWRFYLSRGKDHVGATFGIKKPIAALIEPLATRWVQAAAGAKI